MEQTTPREEWGYYPAMMEMVRKVGVRSDSPMTVYVDVALNNDEPLPLHLLETTGLTMWQYEDGCELHLDGKVLLKTVGGRFYIDAYLRELDGSVGHYVMSNYFQNFGYAAEEARTRELDGTDRPQCHLCWKGESHEHLLESENHTRMGWS